MAAREGMAQTLRSTALKAGSRKQFQDCVSILNLALPFADSPSLKTDLTETRVQAAFLRDVWRKAPSHCLMCAQPVEDWTIFTNNGNGQERLIFLCRTHAQADDNWQQLHMVPHMTRYWNLLPVPPPRPPKIYAQSNDGDDDAEYMTSNLDEVFAED